MPRSLPKRTIKKKIVMPVAPVGRILEMKPSHVGMHHGLTLGTLILVLVAVGSLVAATVAYQKIKTVSAENKTAATKLAQAVEQNADLTQRLKDQEALMALSAKTPPREVVLKEYSSPNLSLYYPENYTIVKATNDFPALTLTKDDAIMVEIFREKDFPGGERALPDGVSDGLSATQVGSTDNPKVAPYDVWKFWSNANGDETINAEIDKIVASIKVVK